MSEIYQVIDWSAGEKNAKSFSMNGTLIIQELNDRFPNVLSRCSTLGLVERVFSCIKDIGPKRSIGTGYLDDFGANFMVFLFELSSEPVDKERLVPIGYRRTWRPSMDLVGVGLLDGRVLDFSLIWAWDREGKRNISSVKTFAVRLREINSIIIVPYGMKQECDAGSRYSIFVLASCVTESQFLFGIKLKLSNKTVSPCCSSVVITYRSKEKKSKSVFSVVQHIFVSSNESLISGLAVTRVFKDELLVGVIDCAIDIATFLAFDRI